MTTQAKCHYKRCQEAVHTPPGPAQGYLRSSAEHSENHRAIVSTQEAEGAGGQHLECVQVVAPPSRCGGHGLHSPNGHWQEQWGIPEADYWSVIQDRERIVRTEGKEVTTFGNQTETQYWTWEKNAVLEPGLVPQ